MQFLLTLLPLLELVRAAPLLTTLDVTLTSLEPTQLFTDYTTTTEAYSTDIQTAFSTQLVQTQLEIFDTSIAVPTTLAQELTTVSEGVPTTTIELTTNIEETASATPLAFAVVDVSSLILSAISTVAQITSTAEAVATTDILPTGTTESAEIASLTAVPTEIIASLTSVPTDIIASATNFAGAQFASLTSAVGPLPTAVPASITSLVNQIPTEVPASLTSLLGNIPTAISGVIPTQIPSQAELSNAVQSIQSRISEIVNSVQQNQGQTSAELNGLVSKVLAALNLQ